MENFNPREKEVFTFFKNFDLKNITEISVMPLKSTNGYYTNFYFYTKKHQRIKFKYEENKEIIEIDVLESGEYLGEMSLMKNKNNKNKKEWMNSIWKQFSNYTSLRIRLMFINKENPWKWKTQFTIKGE